MTAEYQFLEVERRNGFAIVTLNRPERLNALVPELLSAFDAAMADLNEDPDVSVVILTGKGKTFCVGLDVATLQERGPDAFMKFNPAQTISNWKGPVIGAINGLAVTGGFEIAVSCDILLAADSAAFVDTHSRVGLLPGWGLAVRLHRAVGIYRAKEIHMTGRRLPATEAADWGLVNRTVPADELLDAACEMAQAIVAGAPGLPVEMKSLIDHVSAVALGEAIPLERQMGDARAQKAGLELSFAHVGKSRQAQ